MFYDNIIKYCLEVLGIEWGWLHYVDTGLDYEIWEIGWKE